RAARDELRQGLGAILGRTIVVGALRPGAILIGTSKSPSIARLRLPLANLGDEGFLIRTTTIAGKPVTLIAANRDIGVLYGAFAYLRLIQTRRPVAKVNISTSPKLTLRLLNHWDNLDRTIERGYSGPSLWDWDSLPGRVDPRYTDYARANASIGVNGTVLTNVNANAQVLTPAYLAKVKALADAFRPYGIRVYLTARFSAPIEIGGLKTADPFDPAVRAWWQRKADEIYRAIPDFGGFLVKANSEGQPGPQDYGRGHADGANMLAEAIAPHGGIVMWRAFVYQTGPSEDRAKQAYSEFKPLDGKFSPNVILQVKNGPIDFQPREPFHLLFGAMAGSRVAMEVQLTREYLGQHSGIVYLGTMWSEALQSRTFRPQTSSRVSDTIAAMAGVANVGSDRNWSGTHFEQANWYAFGRLAWDPTADPRVIAEEWTRQTWGNEPRVVQPIVAMMMRSRQAAVDYMTPLGLAHLMATGHHYGPAPWVCDLPQASWNPCYYHRADERGIGFDRTKRGSNAIEQYAPEVARSFGDLPTVPDDYLLWFHHVPWTHRMRSGRTVWEELVERYDRGVGAVAGMRGQWDALKLHVNPRRHCEVAASLARQEEDARWWRDASIAYWQSRNKLAMPRGHAPPKQPLEWYKAIDFDEVPGFLAPRIPREHSCVAVGRR
ncbi:MAG TPA: alpha-glucuronidase family glycosyl hydrolase, partial [Sphingomicrobium sp.]|nr:alpha-glucuronidase family glycosyl hydrolase [Sphingomicrobium sp.]